MIDRCCREYPLYFPDQQLFRCNPNRVYCPFWLSANEDLASGQDVIYTRLFDIIGQVLQT